MILKESDFKKLKVEDVTRVPEKSGTYELLKNTYWVVTDDNCILLYRNYSRQCNLNKTIVEHLIKSIHYPFNCRCEYLESVFLPFKKTL